SPNLIEGDEGFATTAFVGFHLIALLRPATLRFDVCAVNRDEGPTSVRKKYYGGFATSAECRVLSAESRRGEMLQTLHIENYALIPKLSLEFGPGLNVLTGETGSGKSIVVDALGLLLGTKGSPDLIRSGADRAVISGGFLLGRKPDLLAEEMGIEIESD